MSSLVDKAIEILRLTHDGEDLQLRDLKLTEMAVNGQLNEQGVRLFERLREEVVSGEYLEKRRWLFGIEHLTMDHSGYVRWKGRVVEHFTLREDNEVRLQEWAIELAQRCQALEQKQLPVGSGSAIFRWHLLRDMDATAEYIEAILNLYVCLADSQDRPAGAIFYVAAGEMTAVALARNEAGEVTEQCFDTAYDAFHGMSVQGYVPCSPKPVPKPTRPWLIGSRQAESRLRLVPMRLAVSGSFVAPGHTWSSFH